MKIKKHLLNLAVTRTSHTLDPLNEYIRYIINFVGSEELVNFSFEAMLNDVDFEQAEHAKWSDVSPDFSFIQFKNLGGQHVKISLGANLRLLFKEAQKNRTSDLIFENQYSLVIRIGAIILLTTGLAASDLKYLNEQSNDIDKQESTENTVKQTRLCLEPWGNYSVGLKGEVVACSKLPALWNISSERELSSGIAYLQKSLVEGNLNCICKNCNIKPLASIDALQSEVESRENKISNKQIVGNLSAIYNENRDQIPPAHLRYRISGTSDEGIFVLNGIQGSTQMMHYVEKYDHSEKPSVLDWGCGCGRYANHIIKKWPQVTYTGCDIDEEGIVWCQENIKGGYFRTIEPYPPTSFADQQFSAVIGSSVMTHLSKNNQELWLKEIARILKPNGIFVVSVLGFTAAARFPGLATKLERKGFVDHNNDPALNGIVPEGYYRDVFQTEKYTRHYWGEYFEVKEYIHAGLMGYQDLVVLQKREVSIPVIAEKQGWLKRLFT